MRGKWWAGAALLLIGPALLSAWRGHPEFRVSHETSTRPLVIGTQSMPTAQAVGRFWRERVQRAFWASGPDSFGDRYTIVPDYRGSPFAIYVILETSPYEATSADPVGEPYIGGSEVTRWRPRVQAEEIVNQGRTGPAVWTMSTDLVMTPLSAHAASRDPLLEPVERMALRHGYRTARAIQMVAPYHGRYVDVLCEFLGTRVQPQEVARFIAHL